MPTSRNIRISAPTRHSARLRSRVEEDSPHATAQQGPVTDATRNENSPAAVQAMAPPMPLNANAQPDRWPSPAAFRPPNVQHGAAGHYRAPDYLTDPSFDDIRNRYLPAPQNPPVYVVQQIAALQENHRQMEGIQEEIRQADDRLDQRELALDQRAQEVEAQAAENERQRQGLRTYFDVQNAKVKKREDAVAKREEAIKPEEGGQAEKHDGFKKRDYREEVKIKQEQDEEEQPPLSPVPAHKRRRGSDQEDDQRGRKRRELPVKRVMN